jgi:hypothetical protein
MKLLAAFLLCAATVAAAAETVDWREAARCAERICTVRGTVAAQEDEDGVIRLYFDPSRRDVSVLLVRSLFVTWPSYVGREIAATGEVRRFRNEVEVVASTLRAVAIVGAAPSAPSAPAAEPTPTDAPAPTGGPPPSPTSADPEVERLRRQVERLEQRVHELEDGAD